MAATGLYPPIVSDSAPAFLRENNCNFYFSISAYNSPKDIQNVQISLINLKTNASAFKTKPSADGDTHYFPSGIKIAPLQVSEDSERGDQRYFITIDINDLAEGQFGLNQYYKIQLRFTKYGTPTPPSSGPGLATWFYDNRDNFSEWSKVCLIKGIGSPRISLKGFDEENKESQEMILTESNLRIIGTLSYEEKDKGESEYLKSYNIKIYETEDVNRENPLFQSEEIYTTVDKPNEFDYQVPYELTDGVSYTMILTYTTNNSYVKDQQYRFIIIQHGIDALDVQITATPNEENGWIAVNIKKDQIFIGNFTIRRTSSESDFHKWEDIKTVAYSSQGNLNYTLYDTTIQSGVWYKYCVQKRNIYGDRGVITQIKNPVMCVLDNIFLTQRECQLKIQFNPTLNDFKYNVTQSQQVTLGGKYPFVKRNGNNYFRTFSIGGLISSFSDTTDWYDPHFYDGRFHNNENEIKLFTSKEKIYGESLELYNDYNDENNITDYNDYIYEEKFREKVYDFLYKHNVKLFRSATEGNILIKLMNISFQPNEVLGRRLFSFTATAVQIDEANISNYEKYGIITIDNFQSDIKLKYDSLGNMSGTYSRSNGNILTMISQKYENRTTSTYNDEVNVLTYLKLEIDSDPYLIVESNGVPRKALTTDTNINGLGPTVGYIIKINGTPIVITPKMERVLNNSGTDSDNRIDVVHNGFFELKGDNVAITSLQFDQPTSATINYVATVERSEDTSRVVRKNYYYYKPGQLYQVFDPEDRIMQKIYNKYLLNYKTYYQRLVEVYDIRLEGPTGAVVYVKDSQDSDYDRHVLMNGYLQLKEDDVTINNLYFRGRHLLECQNPLQFSSVNGVPLTPQDGLYNNLDEIINPVNGGIYQIIGTGLVQRSPSIENHKILVVDENSTEYQEVNSNNIYTLLLGTITDDDKLKFVYYYGCWYVLSKALEKSSLLKADIRRVRDYEYMPVYQTYSTFEQIQNPIPHGVYYITSQQATQDNPDKTFIYYQDKWYPFNINHDVICPIEGIVDYSCEVVKGVYQL